MELSGGNGGWVRTNGEDLNLPGVVYMRATEVDGHLRVTELYVDGRGAPIAGQSLRTFPLSGLEAWISEWRSPSRHLVAGPDLSRLATSFASSFGTYHGRHCEACKAPLQGRTPRDPERALVDWVALSWYAQYSHLDGYGIPQSRKPNEKHRADRAAGELVLSAPPDGRLTDAFLSDVARAYSVAIARRLPPAKTLAELAGVAPRTVQSWFYKARKRGLMMAADKRGRVV